MILKLIVPLLMFVNCYYAVMENGGTSSEILKQYKSKNIGLIINLPSNQNFEFNASSEQLKQFLNNSEDSSIEFLGAFNLKDDNKFSGEFKNLIVLNTSYQKDPHWSFYFTLLTIGVIPGKAKNFIITNAEYYDHTGKNTDLSLKFEDLPYEDVWYGWFFIPFQSTKEKLYPQVIIKQLDKILAQIPEKNKKTKYKFSLNNPKDNYSVVKYNFINQDANQIPENSKRGIAFSVSKPALNTGILSTNGPIIGVSLIPYKKNMNLDNYCQVYTLSSNRNGRFFTDQLPQGKYLIVNATFISSSVKISLSSAGTGGVNTQNEFFSIGFSNENLENRIIEVKKDGFKFVGSFFFNEVVSNKKNKNGDPFSKDVSFISQKPEVNLSTNAKEEFIKNAKIGGDISISKFE